MTDPSHINYSELDHPEILPLIFHQRVEEIYGPADKNPAGYMFIPVGEGQSIGARLHHSGKDAPTILFFHGNGEIVADYDDLGPVYAGNGINFLPVDYRGYGRSTGTPTVTGMMRDCHLIFQYIKEWLGSNHYTGPIIIMGRSLGSASALELAANYRDDIDGLIIESGFAYAIPLLKLLGINIDAFGITEKTGFHNHNIEMIRKFDKPTLIIHAEYDQVISIKEGEALFDACAADIKKFLKIPNADHNTIFVHGFEMYLAEVKELCNCLRVEPDIL